MKRNTIGLIAALEARLDSATPHNGRAAMTMLIMTFAWAGGTVLLSLTVFKSTPIPTLYAFVTAGFFCGIPIGIIIAVSVYESYQRMEPYRQRLAELKKQRQPQL